MCCGGGRVHGGDSGGVHRGESIGLPVCVVESESVYIC